MPETNKANQSPKLKVNQGKVHVATYQLPVGLGDCSIHLLIKKDGTIQSGFIMDGGRNSDEIKAGDVITKGLKTISETYFPSGSKPFLRAWVVTHWDADHYEGVESLLKTNALKNYFVANPVLYAGSEAFPAGMQTLLNELKFQYVIGKDAIGKNFFGGQQYLFPEFCCVGANGYSYLATNNKSLTRIPTLPDENEKSILSLILWRDKNANMSRFSYFCGGDGNPRLELQCVVPNVLKSKTVAVMKLDHHGSAKEFYDGSVVSVMKPDKVIVTPGHQYGHPCWDVVHGIARLYNTWGGDMPLYTTRLPYWADAGRVDQWNQKDANVSTAKTSRIAHHYRKGKYLEGQNFNDMQSDDFSSFWEDVYGGEDLTKKKKGKQKKLPVGKSEKTKTRTTNPVDPNSSIFPRDIAAVDDGELDLLLAMESFPAFLIEESQRTPEDVKKRVVAAVKKDKELLKKRAAYYDLPKAKGKEEEEMELPKVLATIEDRGMIVYLATLLWNSICRQKLNEGDGPKFYMLQLFSSNDDDDGEINIYNWSDMSLVA